MTIDITSLTPGNGSSKSKPSAAVSQDKQGQPAESKNSTATSSVELSTQAQALQKLENKINDISDVDQNRVDTIKAAIKDGTFSINAENIAEKIAQFEKDLS